MNQKLIEHRDYLRIKFATLADRIVLDILEHLTAQPQPTEAKSELRKTKYGGVILPCKFCSHTRSITLFDDELYCVSCCKCQASGPKRLTDREAFEAWNLPTTSAERELAELKEANNSAMKQLTDLRDDAMPKDLAGAVGYMIDHSNDGWQRAIRLGSLIGRCATKSGAVTYFSPDSMAYEDACEKTIDYAREKYETISTVAALLLPEDAEDKGGDAVVGAVRKLRDCEAGYQTMVEEAESRANELARKLFAANKENATLRQQVEELTGKVAKDSEQYPISKGIGPCNTPKCPKCQNSLQNESPCDRPDLIRCATCKTLFRPPVASDGEAVNP